LNKPFKCHPTLFVVRIFETLLLLADGRRRAADELLAVA
jgi:hypothetical protein